MNPLSALRMNVAPEFRAASLPGVETAAKIPQAELAKLPAAGATTEGSAPASFSNLLGDFARDVSDKQAAAGNAVNGLLGGQDVSLHQAMIAMEEASVSFQLMVEVRNKLLESYQELMRMQI